MKIMNIIMQGNLSEGFEAIGPFKTFEEAADYDERHTLDGPSWIMTMVLPENTKKKESKHTEAKK